MASDMATEKKKGKKGRKKEINKDHNQRIDVQSYLE